MTFSKNCEKILILWALVIEMPMVIQSVAWCMKCIHFFGSGFDILGNKDINGEILWKEVRITGFYWLVEYV